MSQSGQIAVEYIRFNLESITGDPNSFEVSDPVLDEKGLLIRVKVDQAQLGRVLGKDGETVKALRTLLRPLGALHGARYSLKVDKR